MAAAIVLGAACDAVLTALRNSPAITAGAFPVPAARIVDQLPQPVVYPTILVETLGEDPFNTLGAPDPSAFGSSARPTVRVLSQYRSPVETYAIADAIRGVLDGLAITVPPFPTALLTFEHAPPILIAASGLVTTREQILEFDLTVHE